VSDTTLSLLLAFGATLSFSSSSVVYTQYSKRFSILWMNCLKALVAFFALAITIPLFSSWQMPQPLSTAGFLLSGLIALNIGDLFLLSAFTRLGVARTLILFGFQPLFMGVAAFFIFDQPLNPWRFLAVFFLIACLFVFSLERYKLEKRWEVSGLVFAIIGVLFDTCGILLSRGAFNLSPHVGAMEGQFLRCTGALLGFAVMGCFRPLPVLTGFLKCDLRQRSMLIVACLGGTYLSLILYLSAVKIGHLASIASIAITGPVFATSIECLVQRKKPSAYLLVAFALFSMGFFILLRTT
jgi:drug/metabolite transporter (DMT)-like permease